MLQEKSKLICGWDQKYVTVKILSILNISLFEILKEIAMLSLFLFNDFQVITG